MKSNEELIGAEVLALVDRFHTPGRHEHHGMHRKLKTAVEALALLSLAHQLAPTRTRRRLALATGALLQHQKRKHGHGHHR
jgi:hypothetical protein